MARLRYNGLTATLGADLLTAGTTITFTAALTSAAGAVPTITGTDYIPLAVLADDGTVLEIMHLTAYTSGATTGAVTRAQESTTAAVHATGLAVINGPTAADLDDLATVATTATDSSSVAETFVAPGADDPALAAAAVHQLNWFQVFSSTESGPVEIGVEPGDYGALWTRDHAYIVWHQPRLMSAENIAGFVTNRLATRSTTSSPDPDGGFLPADFIADRISADGVATYKNSGSDLPFMDGIAFVVLALHTHWRETGDRTLFDTHQTVIDTCLAAIPRSGNGCVYSDPLAPSVDYGFTDGILKTGDVAYGTALQAWAYKMLHEISGDTTYAAARAEAEAGLRTLRQASGWYAGSSVNNADRDDVWATALIAAEGLCTADERVESARTLAAAYAAGTITQRGWVRHLPAGQYWAGSAVAVDEYQNGGYWATPLWDCVRAVALVNADLAREWANEAVSEWHTQWQNEGTVGANTAPYEWFNGSTLSTAKGYSASAALLARFASPATTTIRKAARVAAAVDDEFTTDTSANYTLSGFSYDAVNDQMKSDGLADGEYFVDADFSAADALVTAESLSSAVYDNWPALILRFTDANNYIFCALGGNGTTQLLIYERKAGANTNIGFLSPLQGGSPTDGEVNRLTAWVVGATVKFHAFGQTVTGTTTITGAGKVGCRHGRTGAGYTAVRSLRAHTMPAGTIPSDVYLAHDGGLILPGGSEQVPAFGEYRLLSPSGRVLARGRADGAPVSVS